MNSGKNTIGDKIVLSILVPIYGVEEYIGKFLETLEPNLLPGVEVILVDDGTKDRSGIMADEFAAQHKDYVKVLHKKNGGLSSARNAGLEMAIGEYVIFPDPDDWLDSNYCKWILEAVEKYDHPDMILFDYMICKASGVKVVSLPFLNPNGYISKEKYCSEFIKDDSLKSMVWFRAIKRSFFENTSFREDMKVSEDALLLNDITISMDTFVYVKKPLYYYRIREGSLVRTANVEDLQKVFLMSLDRIDKYKNVVNKVCLNMPVKFCWELLRVSYIENNEIEIQKCEKYICENIMNILFDEQVSINVKKHCILVYLGIAKRYVKWKYRKA